MDRSSFAPSMDRMSKSLSGLMSSTFSGGRPSGPNVPVPMAATSMRNFQKTSNRPGAPGITSNTFGGMSARPISSGGGGGRPGLKNMMSALAVPFRGRQQTYTPPDMFGGAIPGATGDPGTLSGNNPTQYDQYFIQAAKWASDKYGVNLSPALLKAMGHIESGGTFDNSLTRDDGFGDGLSVGIMQVKPDLWGNLVPGYNAYDPLGNIMIGAALMGQSMQQYGSWQAALTNVYFPVNDPNGTTQQDYIDMATQYMQQYAGIGQGGLREGLLGQPGLGGKGGGMVGSGGGTLASIWGQGVSTPTTFGFGAEGGRDLYRYGTALGLNGSQHTGLDIGVPMYTPLYSPVSGTISCLGTADAGIGGTGGGSCGAYGDTDGGGIGNITIKLDNGTFLVLGHSNSASVSLGQRVSPGQMVGRSGGMFGAHTHVEVRVPDPSMPAGYRLVDPVAFFGGGVPSSGTGTGGAAGAPPSGFTSTAPRMWGGRPIIGAAAYA